MRRDILSTLLLFLVFQLQAQPNSPLLDSYQQHLELRNNTEYGLEWIQLGPTLNSARVEAVQAHPDDPNTIYAAFGSGNLWKTTNAGLSWKPIFENQPAQGIGDIAIAPSNPNIIYVGTGESLKKPRNFTMPGTGVYRSDDAGETWMHLGLTDSWHISEIAVHPENPDIVVVAVMGHFWTPDPNRGIYRTEDGGKSWEQVLYIDEKTSGNDVVFAPSDPNIVYVSMWENDPTHSRHLSPDSKGLSGPNSGVYRSTDAGITWKRMNNGIPEDENSGRIGLAVSHTDPDKAYAFLDHRNKEQGKGAGEVYQTLDGGESWEMTHESGLMNLSVIGWYFMDTYVNPQDDEEIFALGVRMAHSTDGGKTFDYIEGDVYHHFTNPAQTLHLDHCEMWINPQDPNHLILGNDGGVHVSNDKGRSWKHLNNIPTGEFYDITLDNQKPYKIYGGVQDDATVYGPAVEWYPEFEDQWEYLWIDPWSGGDGCMTFVDPRDPNTVYFSMQHAAVRRKDMKADTSKSIRPELPEDHEGEFASNFITPYLLSGHNPDKLYLAGNYVFKSENQGDDWTVISGDLSVSGDSGKRSMAAGAFAESPLEEGVLYVGTDLGAFWVSEDDGKNWKEYSKGLPNAYIRSIYPSHHISGRVYLAATGLNYDDLNTYLFLSENNGESWQSIEGNLPNEVANVIIEDPDFENILYAGLLRGVYISTDRGKSWSLLGKNMPMVAIADIEIEPRSKDLVVATHGRGIYKLNLKPIHKQFANSGDDFIDIPTAYLPKRVDTHGDYSKKTYSKVPITFWMDVAEEVQLQLMNDKDSLLWMTKMSATRGFNQFRWDLITKKVSSDSPYFVRYNQFIGEGKYKVILKTSQGKLEEELEVETYVKSAIGNRQ